MSIIFNIVLRECSVYLESMSESRPKILPTIWLVITVVLMGVTHRFLPLVTFENEVTEVTGIIILLFGVAMIAWSAVGFARAGTNAIPFREASALVTGGFYRITRNPMYLGMVLILVGGGLKIGSLGALLPIPMFVVVIRRNFILGEERFLEETFGEEYLEYKKRVRRWL